MSVEAPERIWAWREDRDDVWSGEWSPSEDDAPSYAEEFVRADKQLAADHKLVDRYRKRNGTFSFPEDVARIVRSLDEAKAAFAEAEQENAALRGALRGMFCPRPCNHRPDGFDVGPCFDAGECGCIAGPALARNAGGNGAQ